LGGDRTRSGFGKGVKVALLDSGVDLNHPSLAGSSVEQMYDQDGLLVASETKNSHGTALASVMAGNTETYQGIAPGCEILSYPVIDESGRADTYTVAQAILHAVEDGAEVINLSLGAEQSSTVLRDAVSYAINQDVVVVAAVGNEGIGLVNYPAAYDGVIGVTSIGTGGKVASFSNYGKEVDVAAPGVGVLTAWESGEFANFSGTSVSSAIVSAAIAVERARFPHLTNSQIQELVFSHTMEAEKPGHDEVSGYGVVSLARLENKNNPVYSDPALVGYHFENSPNHRGTIPFEVVFQNQGNTWQGNLELEVRYLGTNKRLPINNFAPGEVRSEKFYVQGSSVKNTLEISAKLIVPKDVADSRPENNDRKSVIRF
jgi:subtilisin family serine protease